MKKLLVFCVVFIHIFAIDFYAQKGKVVEIYSSKELQRAQNPFSLNTFFQTKYNPYIEQTSFEDLRKRLGNGIVISDDGYIITNYHIVENIKNIKIRIADSPKKIPARLIGVDRKRDLALLKINSKSLEFFPYTTNRVVNLGQDIYLLAKPFNSQIMVSRMFVSQIMREKTISKDALHIILQGSMHVDSNGAPLIDKNAQLVGIINAKLSKDAGISGFLVATPVESVRKTINMLLQKQNPEEVWLGISIADLDKEDVAYYKRTKGVVITSIEDKSPAKKASLKRGDLIIAIDDIAIDNTQDLNHLISAMHAGEERLIEFQRDLKTLEAVIKIGAPQGEIRTQTQASAIDGLVLEPLTSRARRNLGVSSDIKGVIVNSVISGSSAANANFKSGDLIIRVDSYEVKSMADFKALLLPKTQNVTVFRRGIITNIVWNKDE